MDVACIDIASTYETVERSAKRQTCGKAKNAAGEPSERKIMIFLIVRQED
jgi:hypothetical protein